MYPVHSLKDLYNIAVTMIEWQLPTLPLDGMHTPSPFYYKKRYIESITLVSKNQISFELITIEIKLSPKLI
jgi:hypothetical protein